MYFILIDDFADINHPSGDLINMEQMQALLAHCKECGCPVASAHCFPSVQDALDWNANQ